MASTTLNYVPNKFLLQDKYDQTIKIPEIKMAIYDMLDPCFLNFRIMINPNQQSGLLAGIQQVDEAAQNNTLFNKDGNINFDILKNHIPSNSAINFLNTIGEYERRDLLILFQVSLIRLLKDYDFLLLDIEGLDQYFDISLGTLRWDNVKLTLQFSETISSLVQGTMMLIRDVVYDFNRECYVLPGNMQSFEFAIMIYNRGYFDSELYDIAENETGVERKMFPTISKINNLNVFTDLKTKSDVTDPINFNYSLIEYEGFIDIIESGKNYFTGITNSGNSQAIVTNLTLNVFQWRFSSSFKEYGNMNIAKMFVLSSELSQIENIRRELNDNNLLQQNRTNDNSWLEQFGDSWGNMVNKKILSKFDVYTNYVKKEVKNISNKLKVYTNPNFLANATGAAISPYIDTVLASFNSKLSEYFKDFNKANIPNTVKYDPNMVATTKPIEANPTLFVDNNQKNKSTNLGNNITRRKGF